MHHRFLAVLFALSVGSAAIAQDYTMTPTSGPTTGGTEVTIKGQFGEWPYAVVFGSTPALETRRVDAQTLVAKTPAHLPGVSEVRIFEYDIFLGTDLTFTFEGGIPEERFERILLPVFTPPVQGAFGSEFHTRLRGATHGGPPAQFMTGFGLRETCQVICPEIPERDLTDWGVTFSFRDNGTSYEPNGKPGRFVFVDQNLVEALSLNLRVFDVSRTGLNFGTQIPVVPESAFKPGRLTLLGVPGDTRFRNTLRIYAVQPVTVDVLVNGQVNRTVSLLPGTTIFDPAYTQIGDLPAGGEDMQITILENGPTDGPATPIWAFVTVTNNETQLITTIAPMP
ncbi:MAG TPA: IPT/TIG domain-containing protein [Thermoanaerobaculia bacterium]|jgi:hypothetical protein|nr:IPT/TIG domain-containing protein [Thermoanaerobaculia bacterium]